MLTTPQTDPERVFTERRRQMVQHQLRPRDITDARVLAAMEKVPRHRFTPQDQQLHAYDDRPLPIGLGQTISQPYIVALMTQLARPQPESRALDVGTGSGYQAAILAELCRQVYSLEIVPELAASARDRLRELGYRNVEVRCGDAHGGWPEQAPFDLIIAAAAPRQVPQPLLDQLSVGGCLVIPIGELGWQELMVYERVDPRTLQQRNAGGVAFVPMTGQAAAG